MLTIAGIELSLDDIQHTILRINYENDPLVMYGLFQGVVGSPSIRKYAYTGDDVYFQLESNAHEFINSYRGTYPYSPTLFRVSSFYDRNRVYFPDFETDLSNHLLNFLEGPQRARLQVATTIDRISMTGRSPILVERCMTASAEALRTARPQCSIRSRGRDELTDQSLSASVIVNRPKKEKKEDSLDDFERYPVEGAVIEGVGGAVIEQIGETDAEDEDEGSEEK